MVENGESIVCPAWGKVKKKKRERKTKKDL